MSSWWESQLNPKLSQGDILDQLLVGTSTAPPRHLGLGPFSKSGKTAWPEINTWKPDAGGMGLFVARGRLVNAIVASHSCELDDKPNASRVLIVPIFPLSALDEASKARILAQERRAFMPLQGIPTLGDYYADLRCLTYVDRQNIDEGRRLASMSEEGILRFQAQMITFLSRVDLAVSLEALKAFLASRDQNQ